MNFIWLGDQFVNLDMVFSISYTHINDGLMLSILNAGDCAPLTVFPSKEELEILRVKTNIDLTELL
ncbi:hypothetical protein [Treponema sp. R80B11-R83G3]